MIVLLTLLTCSISSIKLVVITSVRCYLESSYATMLLASSAEVPVLFGFVGLYGSVYYDVKAMPQSVRKSSCTQLLALLWFCSFIQLLTLAQLLRDLITTTLQLKCNI